MSTDDKGRSEAEHDTDPTTPDVAFGAASLDRPTGASSPDMTLINQKLTETQSQLTELVGIVKEKIVYDETKDKAFEKLYAELERFKKEAESEHLRPFLSDLILLYDRMEHVKQLAIGFHSQISIENIQSFLDELLETLFRRNVQLIEGSASIFDANYQRAVGVMEVNDSAQHQRVHSVVRKGFRIGQRILRPEEVIVYKPTVGTKAEDQALTSNPNKAHGG